MKIYVLNTLAIGMDTLSFISKSVHINGVIGLSDRVKKDNISDFHYQAKFCTDNNLKFIEIDSYGINKTADIDKLTEVEIDVLVVVGWQRLIPKWLINQCRKTVIGIHGSPFGITKGRGRSPQNWTLLLGYNSFYISILFTYQFLKLIQE